jgi:hypothetical protein
MRTGPPVGDCRLWLKVSVKLGEDHSDPDFLLIRTRLQKMKVVKDAGNVLAIKGGSRQH